MSSSYRDKELERRTRARERERCKTRYQQRANKKKPCYGVFAEQRAFVANERHVNLY